MYFDNIWVYYNNRIINNYPVTQSADWNDNNDGFQSAVFSCGLWLAFALTPNDNFDR